jgi:hypothetical protein
MVVQVNGDTVRAFTCPGQEGNCLPKPIIRDGAAESNKPSPGFAKTLAAQAGNA